jgi:DNA polymerase III delta prime subunit
MRHHAFVIEAEVDEGMARAEAWAHDELGLESQANPDVVTLRYGLFTVEDARRVSGVAMQAPLRGGSKVIIIAATRAYHEAQNALLKLFEEPAPGTYLFLILPTLGGLLPTLRSRVSVLGTTVARQRSGQTEIAEQFLSSTKEKRSLMIKKLTTGKDEDERRENRDKALAIVNGIEAIAYAKTREGQTIPEISALLNDVATLRGFLHDRSAPVKMILEHLSLVIPKGLV